MACPRVSQAVCHSATTASVVWPLALDFIFTRCVSPCPRNFNIGCCANEKPLRLIAHRRVRFFTFMYQHWYWGKGGNSLNPIQASENIMILETNDCTSSVFEDRQSTPERTLRWLPLCTLAFSNLVADFYSCLASHLLLICLGHSAKIQAYNH